MSEAFAPQPRLDPTQVPNPYPRLFTFNQVRPLVARGMLSAKPLPDVMIIDSRPKQPRYDQGHIPTAVSLPDSQFERLAPEVLPENKDVLLVFYCGGRH